MLHSLHEHQPFGASSWKWKVQWSAPKMQGEGMGDQIEQLVRFSCRSDKLFRRDYMFRHETAATHMFRHGAAEPIRWMDRIRKAVRRAFYR
jgi:hypothetical protein